VKQVDSPNAKAPSLSVKVFGHLTPTKHMHSTVDTYGLLQYL
jgi:hypothetical protein